MDNYWRLESNPEDSTTLKEELKAGGYTQVPKGATLQTLCAEWWRMSCGQTHYDGCTNAELKRFVSDRRLHLPYEQSGGAEFKKQRSLGSRQMINLLKDADDQQTFDQFFQLPGELQSLICERYMDFDSMLATPTQPPLARTCRHLHKLVLPIFYSIQRFPLSYAVRDRYAHWSRSEDEKYLRLDTNERLWLSCLSPAHLACIKKLYLTSVAFGGISIDLEKSKAGFRVEVHGLHLSVRVTMADEHRQALVRELSLVLEQVEWVEGMRRLKMDDIHALRKALEAAYVGLKG